MEVLPISTSSKPSKSPSALAVIIAGSGISRNKVRLIQPSSRLTHEIVDLLHTRRWGYIWMKALYYQLRCDPEERKGTYSHGEFGDPDRKLESVPVLLDLAPEVREGGAVDVYGYVIWFRIRG